MGLDQYAYITSVPIYKFVGRDGHSHSNVDEVTVKDFYWRKHAKLQTFMEKTWYWKNGFDYPEPSSNAELNCEYMELQDTDLLELADAIEDGFEHYYCEGGFFYGHQFQDESAAEYKDNDKEFVKQAREALAKGHRVYYSCWY